MYEKLIVEDKVDLLLAPYAEIAHAAAIPAAEKHRFPLVGSTCGSMSIRKFSGVKYFWYVSALADAIMPTTVDMFATRKDKLKSVAILYGHMPFLSDNVQFLQPALKAKGFDIVLLKDYPTDTQDLSQVLLEIKRKNPDILVFLSFPHDGLLIMKQMMEIGLNSKLVFFLLGPAIADFPKIFGPAIEGITFFADNAWSRKGPGPGSGEFHKKYVERFGGIDYENSPLGYVSAQITEQAVEKAGTLDREKIRDTIANGEFTTIFGPVKFSGIENMLAVPGVRQWQKGEVEMVWPQKVATAPLLFPKPPWPKR